MDVLKAVREASYQTFEYMATNGARSVVDVGEVRRPINPPIIIFRENTHNPGMSVTNAAETLIAIFGWKRYPDLAHSGVIWLETYDGIIFDRITLNSQGCAAWQRLSESELEAL